ncbi:hypothetical protein PMKS-002285 [Pichia membranifaciens]|uniref:Xylanolytic transcriptional activator regulatory domain-containing protein n=1 Tax=Pichia membranifaciens TaxID=4926 RepID=A0A1Q2YGY7_9ASCO|nr:hypothetical protein PMKS-002285 [Pichia membranifaciens]
MNNIDTSNYKNILPGISDDEIPEEDANEDDPMVSLSDKFDAMVIKENKILHSGTTSYVTFIVRDKQLARIFEAYSKRHIMVYESYKQKQKVKASDFPVDISQNHLSWLTSNATTEVSACDLDNVDTIQFGNIVNPPAGVTTMQAKLVLDVLEDINKKMPPLFVVNVLVDHFFKYVYPFLPLVNEEIFRDELSYVLVPTDHGGCKVAITHLQNTSIVSLLLVILRYAYLAVNVKDYAEDNKAIGNDLLIAMIKSGYQIDSSFVVIAKSLLMALPAEDSVFKKITLRNIQVLLYLRLYQVYSPEMHEESREHSLTLALVIQMCRSLGANRDPKNFPQVFQDPREITVWRRIFYKLLTLDVQNAFEYGCSLIISDEEYDVNLPALSKEESQVLSNFKKGLSVSRSGDEIKRLVVENSINKDTALEYEAVELIREGLNTFQNFKSSTKKSRLLKIVNRMQDFVDKRIPSLWEMLQENSNSSYMQLERLFDIPKVRKFEIRLTVQTILMTFYYLLYLNDEDEGSGSENSSPQTTNNNNSCSGANNFETSPAAAQTTSSSTSYSSTTDSTNSKPSPGQRHDFLSDIYGVRATELALSVLKMNYDYTKYVTQSPTLDGDSKQYKALKYFSAKCDVFILNRIAMAFLRPFLFLCSIFLKNLNSEGLTFEEILKKFSNSIDSTVVLKWFNINVTIKKEASKNGCEFSFLLFQYVKNLFFMHYTLKNEYFISWRNTMIIKLFINYFKSADKGVCSEFLHPTIIRDDDESSFATGDHSTGKESGSDFMDMNSFSDLDDFHFSGNENRVLATGNTDTTDSSNDAKLMQDFMDTAAPENNLENFESNENDLDNLIYDDMDNMIDDMFRDTGVRRQMEFELFGSNHQKSLGQVINLSEITEQDRNKFEQEINNMVSTANMPSFSGASVAKSGSTSSGSGGSGPFTSMSGTSANSNMRTPDMSMFTDSPIDFNKDKMNQGTGIQDIIDELQDKGLF